MTSDNVKEALQIAHDNWHSTSRILRNLKLIRLELDDTTVIDKRLEAIEAACIECRKQFDELYKLLNHDPRRSTNQSTGTPGAV